MSAEQFLGIFLVVLAGLWMGSGGWPIKLMKKYQYEHFGFVAMVIGLVLAPWIITLYYCPNALEVYKSVWDSNRHALLVSNAWSLSWGVANVLCFLCFIRIGFCLTGGILTGLGVSTGVMIPMIFKGSGLFKDAKDITSPAGLMVMAGVVVMLVGVVLVSFAGLGRDKVLQKKADEKAGSFVVGLFMAVIAGITSAGMSLSFVYSQGPIKEAMLAHNVPSIVAETFAVWAVGIIGGAAINILYPAFLMTKHKSWAVLASSPKELLLSILMGLNTIIAVVLMGKGMLSIGAMGASIGFGIQQASQMIGNQSVGFIGGEWKGVYGKPRNQMYLSILVLILAAVIMAGGNYVASLPAAE